MIFRLFAFAALLLGTLPVALPAQSPDGLYVYFQYWVVARSFKPDQYFFLQDGRYLNDAPPGEISKAAFEAGCKATPQYCGTYKLSGTSLTLTGRDGKSSTSTFKTLGGDKVKILGLEGSKVTHKFPANTKLDGRYGATSGYGNIMSARAYDFHPDGTFSFESVGAVRTPGMGSATSANGKTGTYRLSGNTLELTINGQPARLLAYDLGNLNNLIMIEGQPYSRKK